MKITNDPVSAVEQQQAEQKTQRANQGSGSFGDLLAQELSGETVSTQDAAATPPLGINPLLLASAPAVEQTQAEPQVMESLDNIMSDWEDYAGKLDANSDGSELKEAYSKLEHIGGEIERLKAENPNMAETNPGLKSVVDEMEILNVTETYKFNRGDYI
ncbi:hypothetical protein dsx2_1287 [Desulfovibrio sp. X2]|uniref:hypothetical protein n=1 Tax=Desulfovibrio sp. X2 TaxID=941449 RepID=UPI000358C4F3|nr:hypothetical protein [Desulfovibrio sp. X2]EPR44659.1 hypothetical protein dsx2_1287 [Desulfovibrio sp. X2]